MPKGEKVEGKLTEEAQRFCVTSLAMFDPPAVVRDALKAEYNFSLTPQSVQFYDPTKHAGRKLGAKWVALFHETREAFLKEAADVPIANRSVRLRALDRMAKKAETQGNMALAAQLHEQAAKEVGDVYTNTRKLAGHDGGAIKTAGETTLDLTKASVDQLRAIATLRIPSNNGS